MSAPALHVLLFGARGRMGQAIHRLAEARGIAATPLNRDSDSIPETLRGPGHVVIDFSSPVGAERALALALDAGIPLLSGTTGLDADYFRSLDAASKRIPVLHAANMSLGIAVLKKLARQAAEMLPESFDIELIELHHRAKRDSPSGTGLALVEAATKGRGRTLPDTLRCVREGDVGPRSQGEIGAFAIRGGDVAGEHTLFYLGEGERLELTHRATTRDIFAEGALHAAHWLRTRGPGRWDFDATLSTPSTRGPASA